jgi:hypothetical protein
MEVLLSSAQNHDAKILPTTRSQNWCANAHSSFPTESYDEEQYDIDTSVDTIWVNAHNTVLAHYSNGTHVSDDAWSKLLQDSRNKLDESSHWWPEVDPGSKLFCLQYHQDILFHAIQEQPWTRTLNLY